jgi:hypothetical protein
MTSTPPNPPRRRPTARQATAGAAVLAALAGAAVAGTFAGADQRPAATVRAATTTAKPLTAAQKQAAAKKAAAKKKASVRVLVKRGLRGKQGVAGKRGARGPQGAAATDVARSLSLNWKGSATGKDTAGFDVPGIGRLTVTCNLTTQELRLTPAGGGSRTVLTADIYSGTTGDHQRASSADGSPMAVQLPVSGLITANLSIEPVSGDGGPGPAPATVTLSVESKKNADPADPQDFNYCYVAAQALQATS